MKLRFGQIEDILQMVHAVPDDMRSQFRSRLRNLIRVGLQLPSRAKGRSANFYPADMFKMAFAVELLQIGLPPERAALIASHNWPAAVEGLFAARRELRDGKVTPRLLVMENNAIISATYRLRAETGASLSKMLGEKASALTMRRLTIINLTAMVVLISQAALTVGVDATALEASLDEDEQIIIEQGARV
jgi:hypothetical protein